MSRRADITLVERGFFESRARARAAIEAGLVAVDGVTLKKPADPVGEGARIEARAPFPWVSRGGVKLHAALAAFRLEPRGKLALDIGASTGGFTDVLLDAGAARVYAVDVGRGQLHERLRGDPRVVSMEGRDARALVASDFEAPPQFLVCDASFISLKLVLPASLSLAHENAALIALIKPQFEAGPARVRKGVVRDEAVHAEVCRDIGGFVEGLGWRVCGLSASPIEGGDGNREFLLGATRGAPA